MIKYTKQNISINDSYIEQNTSWRIVSPLFQSVSIYDGNDKYISDLDKFSKQQKYIFAVGWYRSEVDNGGHDQFFFNSTGIVFQDALDGLKEMGAKDFYEILKDASDRMGNGLSKDRSIRVNCLENENPEFDDLDKKFYELDRKFSLEKFMKDYILRNKDKFYFEGIIEVPVLT